MMREQLPQGLENLIQSIGDMPIPENGEADISIKIRGNDVMERPMFAAGGGANKFPDLSGDGQVTQKDILMGRGVIQKQAGGPIPDMPMQAPVEPPPEQMMQVQEVEQQADMEGEQVGLDYLARTMDGIDAAEDVEEMINAMRGNDMPIEARRMELAEFVGRDDAMATPETVLAMVQPTIMMSEEGAMNSGIGDLMRQMTQDVDMATEGGAPTDMGEGLGGLMMAGAPMPQQPVQGFAQGGAVKKFQDGGGVSNAGNIQGYYDEYLPFFQNIIGDYDSDRDKDVGLAMAKAGFQFASGRGPKGENIAGRPFLSQLGTAGTQFAEDIGQIRKDYRKQDLGLRTLAAQSAMKDVQTDKATAAATQAAYLKYARDLQLRGLEESAPVIKVLKDLSGRERLTVYNPRDGQLEIFTTEQDAEGYASRLGTEANMMTDIGNNLPFFQTGKLSEPNMNAFLRTVDTVYAPASGVRGGLSNKLPLELANALVEADNQGKIAGRLNEKIIREARVLTDQPAQKILEDLKENIAAEQEAEKELIPIIKEGMPVPSSFGALNTFRRSWENATEYYRDITGGKKDLDDLDSIIKTDVHMNHLANAVIRLQYEHMGSARLKAVVELAIDQANKLYATRPAHIPATEEWTRANDVVVYESAKKLKDEINRLRDDAKLIQKSVSGEPGTNRYDYKEEDITGANKLLGTNQLDVIELSLDNVIGAFERELARPTTSAPADTGFKKRSDAQQSLREKGIFKPEDEQLSPALDML